MLVDIARAWLTIQEVTIIVLYGWVAIRAYKLYGHTHDRLLKTIHLGTMLLGVGVAIKASAILVTVAQLTDLNIRPVMWQASALFMILAWNFLFRHQFHDLSEYIEQRRRDIFIEAHLDELERQRKERGGT